MLSFSNDGFSVNRIFNFLLTISWNSFFVLQLINIPFSMNYYVICKVDNSVMFYMNSKNNFTDGKA